MNENCLSHWLPILQSTGVPTPKTEIVRVPEGCNLFDLLDCKTPVGFGDCMFRLRTAAGKVGYPCFLRTGQTSNKHAWKDTCFVASEGDLASNACNLVEFSAMCDMMGLPCDVWAVREFLELESSFTAFNGFPVNRERRYFIRDHKIECGHAYWPPAAVVEGMPTDAAWMTKLHELNTDSPTDAAELAVMAACVAKAFDGWWSVDFAKTKSGKWYCIDMAKGERSYHWLDCPHCPPEMRAQYAEWKDETYIGDSLIPVAAG